MPAAAAASAIAFCTSSERSASNSKLPHVVRSDGTGLALSQRLLTKPLRSVQASIVGSTSLAVNWMIGVLSSPSAIEKAGCAVAAVGSVEGWLASGAQAARTRVLAMARASGRGAKFMISGLGSGRVAARKAPCRQMGGGLADGMRSGSRQRCRVRARSGTLEPDGSGRPCRRSWLSGRQVACQAEPMASTARPWVWRGPGCRKCVMKSANSHRE